MWYIGGPFVQMPKYGKCLLQDVLFKKILVKIKRNNKMMLSLSVWVQTSLEPENKEKHRKTDGWY